MSNSADCERRTYRWPAAQEQRFKPLDLRFEMTSLASEVDSDRAHQAWGLTAGALAVHPVANQRGAVGFRVSHLGSGGAVADFDTLEAAFGFVGEVQGLDWSGTREQADKLAERNRAPVLAAYRRWSRLGTEEVGE